MASDTLNGRRIAWALALVAIAVACTHRPITPASPDALAPQALIRRDTFGIPHILADTEEAAAFALGFAQAEDHAIEIARRYIRARGEGARYFGEGALDGDVAMAQFDNLAEARKGLDQLSPEFRRVVSAFVAGVNRYVERNRTSLPVWVPALEPADVLAHSRAGAVDALAGPSIPRQLQQKYAGQGAGSPEPGGASAWTDEPGSNAFALAGSRTTTGKPILLGNPHLGWSSLYWEAHVRVPGRIDFYGSTLAGIPVLRAGFNDRLGFVTTNNAPDLDDVFALDLDPSAADRYRFDGGSMPLTRREASIRVLASDGTQRTESRTFWDSHIGPVIHRTAHKVFVVKSARLDAHRYFEGFYRLSRARSLAEWRRALSENLVPTSNFTYADADGNIMYVWNGRVPVRAPGVDPRLDISAARAADVWTKVHAVDDLPRLLNPPGGYIQNANNPPRFVSLRDPIDIDRHPAYFERGPLALRPQLALDLLERQARFSVQDVIALKYNTRLLLGERVRDALLDAVGASPDASADVKAGAEAIAAWDGRAAVASEGAVLFQRFWDGYVSKVREPFATRWQAENPASTPAGLSDPAQAVAQLEAAVRATRLAHGSERVEWGQVNRFRFGPLDLPGDGASGAYGAFRVMRFDASGDPAVRVAGNLDGNRPLAGFGDAWVLVVDFSGSTTGWSVLAYGQTADLGSPHSRDQIRIFAAHQLRRAWYTEAEIRSHLEREYRPD
jgi:acyl-homoserine-lactone acylase